MVGEALAPIRDRVVIAVTFLAYVMYRVELAGKRTDVHLRELREALGL